MRMRTAAQVSVVLGAAVIACGNDNKGKPDAKMPDAAIDAKIFNDAAIDAPPNYDLTCFGRSPTTTATDPVTVSGTTETFSMGGPQAVGMVAVDSFKSVAPNVAINSVVSNATTGAFTTGNLDVGNTGMAADVFLRGEIATYRSSFLYPPFPLTKAVTNVPLALLSNTTFGTLAGVFGVTQDDANNGVLFVAVTDCANTPISGATLKVQQAGADVGTQEDLGALAAQAKGVSLVFNVPDGSTQVFATFMGMTFPTHNVLAHKKPNGANAEATMTFTQIPPGPP